MIYVSSSCIKSNKIEDSIKKLAHEGFLNIELSGGTLYQENTLDILLNLKEEFKLNYLCHNYFPAPKIPFVLNLASLNDSISELSLNHIKKAIDWSILLGADKFAFHAGFMLDIPLNQVGEKIRKIKLFDETKSYERFASNLAQIKDFNQDKIKLYVENNVLSMNNFKSFDNHDPFFFTSSYNLKKLNLVNDFSVLLDVAHLKVSCNTLSLDFCEELSKLYLKTDYVHFSDNNGLIDSNGGLEKDSELFNLLNEVWEPNKTLTIEVYSGMDEIKKTYNILETLNKSHD